MLNQNDNRDTDVDSAGVGFGTKLTYQGFSVVASGFYASALGIRGQHSVGSSTANVTAAANATGALDDVGTERNSHMVVTYKVHMTLVKVLLLVTHMVETVLHRTGK